MAASFEGYPPFLYAQILSNFIFIFANPENFLCLGQVVRKFDFWQPHLKETPHFGTPNCFKLYVSFTFAYLKNFMCSALKVKKFEFWRFLFRGNSLFWNP